MKFTKETFKRMARTFLQTVVAYIGVNFVLVDFTEDKAVIKSALVGLLISAIASGLSAVMNLQSPAKEEEE